MIGTRIFGFHLVSLLLVVLSAPQVSSASTGSSFSCSKGKWVQALTVTGRTFKRKKITGGMKVNCILPIRRKSHSGTTLFEKLFTNTKRYAQDMGYTSHSFTKQSPKKIGKTMIYRRLLTFTEYDEAEGYRIRYGMSIETDKATYLHSFLKSLEIHKLKVRWKTDPKTKAKVKHYIIGRKSKIKWITNKSTLRLKASGKTYKLHFSVLAKIYIIGPRVFPKFLIRYFARKGAAKIVLRKVGYNTRVLEKWLKHYR